MKWSRRENHSFTGFGTRKYARKIFLPSGLHPSKVSAQCVSIYRWANLCTLLSTIMRRASVTAATAGALWIGRYEVRQAALIVIASWDNCGYGHPNSHNDASTWSVIKVPYNKYWRSTDRRSRITVCAIARTGYQCGQRMEYSMEFSSIHVINWMEWCYY